jgi:uncharacterized protein
MPMLRSVYPWRHIVQFNVATLLQEPVGSRREGRLEDEPLCVENENWSALANGKVRLLRSDRGVLVTASITTVPTLECARCLDSFQQELTFRITEEFVVPYDLMTGKAISDIDEDEFEIDELHQLDLSEAVRQYEQTVVPLQPVCRVDCAGLCPVCGQNYNDVRCECVIANSVGPWEALTTLGEQLRAKENDGVTET